MTSLVSPQEAASELLRRRQARNHLIDFAQYTTPNWYPGRIHREIAEVFDAVARKEIDRVILECPPQHGKSTLASKRFPAFQLGIRPDLEIVSASATATLAEEFGGAVRDCVGSHEFKQLFPQVQLSQDSRAKGRWTTSDGGGYHAIGIGGQLFGKGGHLGIIDDPFASWEDGQSDLARKRVIDWYTGTFYNRIRPGGAIVVIQHRLHEDDLVGHLVRAEGHGADRWKIVSIPADLDNPPWAERYDRAALERIKSNTFARKWNALYMQNPAPEDGDYFKKDWFKRYTDAPKELNVYITGDFAVSANEGDYTELAVWGIDSHDNVFAIDWWSGRTSADVWIDRLLDMAARWKPIHFVGETGPIRRAIEPLLERRMRETGSWVTPVWLTTSADKASTARTFQGMAAQGRVHFPKTDWAERVIDQLLRFPGGRYDDAVDTCSLLGRHLAQTWAARETPAPVAHNWNAPLTIGQMLKR